MSRDHTSPTITTEALRGYARDLRSAAYATAGDHAPVVLRVGASRFSVRFDGPATTGALLPAWRALLADESEAPFDGVLHVATAAACGPAPAMPMELGRPSVLATLAGDAGGVRLEQRADGAVSMWDAQERTGVWWATRPEAIGVADRVMPLQPVLRWALASQGMQVLRASVIATARGGLLVVGAPGSGSTTTALAARRAGLATLADGVVAVSSCGLMASAVSSFAVVDDRTLQLLPELAGRLAQLPRLADGRQAVVLDTRPLRELPSVELRAVIVPERGTRTGEGRLLEASEAEELLTAATSLRPGGGAPAMVPLPDAVRALPTFALTVGPQPDAIAHAVAALAVSLDAEE